MCNLHIVITTQEAIRAIARTLIIFLIASLPASAFDAEQVIEDYYAVRGQCRIGETTTGIQLTAEQIQTQCGKLAELGTELKANGYCWDKSEVEWIVSK